MLPSPENHRVASSTVPQSVRTLLPTASFFPNDCNPICQKLTTDASIVEPGDLYLHLEECDALGAEWAVERGAAAVIAERILPGLETPLAVVEDIRSTYNLLCETFQTSNKSSDDGDNLSEDLLGRAPLITIGGSIGRSTVAELVASIALSQGRTIGLRNSDLEADGGGLDIPTDQVNQWLGRCNMNEVDLALLASNPQDTTIQQTPSVACVTSLRCDGLQSNGIRHWESSAEHRKAVEKSLGELSRQTTLVLNADDADCLALASTHTGPLLTYGELPHADVRAMAIESHTAGQVFIVTYGKESAALSVSLPGAAFRSNCLAAITTSVALGLKFEQAVRGVEVALPRSGMVEAIVCGQDFSLQLDRARRPQAIRAAIEAARSSTTGKVYVAMPLVNDASIANDQLSAAECMADRVFASTELEAFSSARSLTTLVEDRLQSLALAIGLADAGDVVLAIGYDTHSEDRDLIEGLLRHRLTFEV